MTTFTTDDRLQCQIEIMQKISNDHYKELSDSLHRKPMSQDQIDSMAYNLNLPYDITKIVRAVEKAHGIV